MTQGQRLDCRRYFIGGSDARIIMGKTSPPCCGSGARSVAKSIPRTYRAISSSSSAL
jgi:hypothetical protein